MFFSDSDSVKSTSSRGLIVFFTGNVCLDIAGSFEDSDVSETGDECAESSDGCSLISLIGSQSLGRLAN